MVGNKELQIVPGGAVWTAGEAGAPSRAARPRSWSVHRATGTKTRDFQDPQNSTLGAPNVFLDPPRWTLKIRCPNRSQKEVRMGASTCPNLVRGVKNRSFEVFTETLQKGPKGPILGPRNDAKVYFGRPKARSEKGLSEKGVPRGPRSRSTGLGLASGPNAPGPDNPFYIEIWPCLFCSIRKSCP